MVHEVDDSEFAFVRLGYVSDLSCLLFDLQKAILEYFGMPFNDMEQEELNLPFDRADLVRSNAVSALQILNYEITIPGGLQPMADWLASWLADWLAAASSIAVLEG